MASDTYTFWGMVLSEGEVTPANKDIQIYYTEDSVQNNTDGLVGTDVRLVHLKGDEKVNVKIGEVLDFELLKDNLFVLNQIERDLWENFVDSFEEQENGIIRISFNQLVEEIDEGNLALSAGLTNAATTTTPVHENTVVRYDWNEVSIVPRPASPGAWAWGCDEQCQVVFQETMSEQEVELEPSEDGEETVEQEGEVHNEPTTPDVIQMGDEEFKLVPVDEVEQGDCNCDTESLKQELKQVKSERDDYKELLDEFRQSRREELTEDLKELNQKVPDDRAYDEEELEQMCEDKEISHLEDQVDLMERLVPVTEDSTLEQGEEDLSGSSESSGSDELEQKKERVNQISRDLFGKDFNQVMADIEEGN